MAIPRLTALVHQVLGSLHQRRKASEKAPGHFEKALVLQRSTANRRGMGETLVCLGETYAELRQHQEAERRINESLAMAQKLGDPPLLLRIHSALLRLGRGPAPSSGA